MSAEFQSGKDLIVDKRIILSWILRVRMWRFQGVVLARIELILYSKVVNTYHLL
jgi:hypothetical protein